MTIELTTGFYKGVHRDLSCLLLDYIYAKEKTYAVLTYMDQVILIVEIVYKNHLKEVTYLPVEAEKQLELFEMFKKEGKVDSKELAVTIEKVIRGLEEAQWFFWDYASVGEKNYAAVTKANDDSAIAHFLRIEQKEPLRYTVLDECKDAEYEMCCDLFIERNMLNWTGWTRWGRVRKWLYQEVPS